MADDVKTTTETTTTTTPSTPTTPVPATPQATSSQLIPNLTLLLSASKEYGIATVLCFVFVLVFIIPMRDGHLEFLKVTGKAVEEQVETSKKINVTNEKIAIGLEKVSDAVDSVKESTSQSQVTNEAILNRSAEHYTLSKETHDDVKAIKEAVVKPKILRP